MKKILMTLAAVLCCEMTITAEPVSPQAAREAAAKFLKEKGARLEGEVVRSPRRAAPQVGPAFPSAQGGQSFQGLPGDGDDVDVVSYYVFNASASRGFVVVSGDDCVGTNLVLGYSPDGSFDADNVPDNLRWWLDEMDCQISALSRLGVKAKALELHEDIDTLVTALWDQGANYYEPRNPYNMFCPEVGGKLCVTGCMATALAQVMYYHRWPQEPIAGPLPAYTSTPDLELDELPVTSFDWDLMVDDYTGGTTDDQQKAVAKLMRYIGQSVQMSYTPSLGSGLCYDLDLLVRLFGYDQDLFTAHSEYYTPSGWDNLIYNELKEGRPLVYMGFSTGMGHAFVVDGYRVEDGVGLYHVNWGWGGDDNGYFRMALLDPSAHGTGSSTTSDGYNRSQRALVGLQPAKGERKNYGRYLEGMDWNVTADSIPNRFTMINTSCQPGSFAILFAEEAADGTLDLDNTGNCEVVEFPGYNFLTMQSLGTFDLPEKFDGLAPGWHKIRVMQRETGTDAPWKPVYGPNCSVDVLVDDAGLVAESVIHPVARLTTSTRKIKVDGVKMRSLKQTISLPVTNEGDEDYIGGLACVVYGMRNSTLAYPVAVSYTGIMIEAGETVTVSFPVSVNSMGELMAVVSLTNDLQSLAGCLTSEISKSPGHIGHRSFVLEDLPFYIDDLDYNVTTYGQGKATYSIDFAVANYTTMDYDAAIVANLYTITEDNYIVPYEFPFGEVLFSYLMLPGNSQDYVSIFLPAPLEPARYYVDLLIANDFKSMNSNDYFSLDGWVFTVEDPTGISLIPEDRHGDGPDSGEGDSCYYTLDGRRVSGMPTAKGLYIYKGKKRIVK